MSGEEDIDSIAEILKTFSLEDIEELKLIYYSIFEDNDNDDSDEAVLNLE